MSEWVVQWCGHDCAGNPHPTRSAAAAWLKRLNQERIDAKQPAYGSYRIIRRRPKAEREAHAGRTGR